LRAAKAGFHMRPWQHALSSSRKTARPWTDDLPVHEFMDMTKASYADSRHRMVLHNVDLGVELAERAFPGRGDVRGIALQHVIEDLGCPYTLREWLERCDVKMFPHPFQRRLDAGKDGVIELVAAKQHPCARAAVEEVYDILALPLKYAPDYSSLGYCVLMNTAGPPIVRRICGAPQELEHAHGRCIVDMAWIAEALIFTMFGRIPELSEVVRCCAVEGIGRPRRQNG
jgi:hypothetical protein